MSEISEMMQAVETLVLKHSKTILKAKQVGAGIAKASPILKEAGGERERITKQREKGNPKVHVDPTLLRIWSDQGVSYQEMARRLGVSESTVGYQLMKAGGSAKTRSTRGYDDGELGKKIIDMYSQGGDKKMSFERIAQACGITKSRAMIMFHRHGGRMDEKKWVKKKVVRPMSAARKFLVEEEPAKKAERLAFLESIKNEAKAKKSLQS